MRYNYLPSAAHCHQTWNKTCIIICSIGLHIDPLFFYIPVIDDDNKCLDSDKTVKILATVLRSILDFVYIVRIMLQFQPGPIVPSSPEFGGRRLTGGSLARTARKIYSSSSFLIDILSIIPLPQMVVWELIPISRGSRLALGTTDLLKMVVILQSWPRSLRIYLIRKQTMLKIFEGATWTAAAFWLHLCILASHVVGACWYIFSIEKELLCWQEELKKARLSAGNLYCGQFPNQTLVSLLSSSSCALVGTSDITRDPKSFNFGIYTDALTSGVVESSTGFLQKLFYCFWWGLRNLSSVGQNLETSTFLGEIIFALLISISSLVLFTLLIANIQNYNQSIVSRKNKAKQRRQGMELWMSRQKLPQYLRKRIRRYEKCKWQNTKSVDEETLISNLPKDMRRDVKRHLCSALLTKVPQFETMDAHLLDTMCERLKPVLYTERSYIFREGDPVDEMIFIKRGSLNTVTTNGGTLGFSKSCILNAGEYCGEELVTWILDPNSSLSSQLPISTRTVRTISEVEAYALMADDLKFIASQLHTKQQYQVSRFYSQQWRTWAAYIIQKRWLRYRRKKMEQSLFEAETRLKGALAREVQSPSLGVTIYASRFATNALRSLRQNGETRPYI